MSFTAYVPCNCEREKKISIPPFIEKLELRFGIYDIKEKFQTDLNLELEYNSWQFCEHNQIAVEFSMSQGILTFKEVLKRKYKNRFINFQSFLPLHNSYFSGNYDKEEAIAEIKEFDKLEGYKFHQRMKQFINLLNAAIKMEKEIYWV